MCDLARISQELVSRIGVQVPIRVEGENNRTNDTAEYDTSTNTITVYERELRSAALHCGVSVEKYLECVICHEIGHAMDPHLEQQRELLASFRNQSQEGFDEFMSKERLAPLDIEYGEHLLEVLDQRFNIEVPAEERACILGERYISESLRDFYSQHSKELIEAYRERYRQERKEIEFQLFMGS